jgi:hypothetical protein
MMNSRLRNIAAVLSLALVGCLSEHPAPPLTLPPCDGIVALNILDARARTGHHESTEIRNRGTLCAYIDRLAALNHGWFTPRDTFPSLGITVALLNARGKTVVVTWIDRGMLGGREFEPADGGQRLIRLSPVEYARILSLLGLSQEPQQQGDRHLVEGHKV